MTPIWACGLECGGTAYSGEGHWDTPSGSSIDTVTVRSGLRSLRANPTAGQGWALTAALTGSLRWVGRIYIRFTTLPDADTILVWLAGTAPNSPCVFFKVSDSKIYAAIANNGAAAALGATGATVTTGIWYRVDFDFNINTAGADFCDVQVDGTALGQATGTGLSITPSNAFFGAYGDQPDPTVTADVYFDDIILSNTAADYPIGAGHILSYIPNADGTHNIAGANDFERTLTGTDITNATTDAWTLIDERPLPTTAVDFINGIAPPNATDYVEWQYEDSVEADAPRAVFALFICHDAGGAGSNNTTVTLREHGGGTTANIFTGTANNGATLTSHRAIFATVPGTADAWTTTEFNALRSRFLVADASPDPYIDAIMLEAEFPDAVAAAANPPYRNPMVHLLPQ